jgi:hypothetical protein
MLLLLSMMLRSDNANVNDYKIRSSRKEINIRENPEQSEDMINCVSSDRERGEPWVYLLPRPSSVLRDKEISPRRVSRISNHGHMESMVIMQAVKKAAGWNGMWGS